MHHLVEAIWWRPVPMTLSTQHTRCLTSIKSRTSDFSANTKPYLTTSPAETTPFFKGSFVVCADFFCATEPRKKTLTVDLPWKLIEAAEWSRMGRLRWVGALKLYVSFAKEPCKREDILQKRPRILRSLPIVASPYHHVQHIPPHAVNCKGRVQQQGKKTPYKALE